MTNLEKRIELLERLLHETDRDLAELRGTLVTGLAWTQEKVKELETLQRWGLNKEMQEYAKAYEVSHGA